MTTIKTKVKSSLQCIIGFNVNASLGCFCPPITVLQLDLLVVCVPACLRFLSPYCESQRAYLSILLDFVLWLRNSVAHTITSSNRISKRLFRLNTFCKSNCSSEFSYYEFKYISVVCEAMKNNFK